MEILHGRKLSRLSIEVSGHSRKLWPCNFLWSTGGVIVNCRVILLDNSESVRVMDVASLSLARQFIFVQQWLPKPPHRHRSLDWYSLIIIMNISWSNNIHIHTYNTTCILVLLQCRLNLSTHVFLLLACKEAMKTCEIPVSVVFVASTCTSTLVP